MAGPQKENGYTPIANELLESIYGTNFTSTEFKIMLFTMRYTYGFSRKEHEISLNFISKGIGISKRYVSSSVGKLIEDDVLKVVREHTDTQSRVIKLNKHYDKWKNRTTVQQMNYSSTVEAENNTTDEVEFNTTDEVEFHQDKQNLKQNLKQVNTPEKPKKHKYGEYKHVLLMDQEKERLTSEFGQATFDRCIKKLDEYIETTGKKYRNHNLVIKKWVIDAVKEDEKKEGVNKTYGEKYNTGDCNSTDYYKQFITS